MAVDWITGGILLPAVLFLWGHILGQQLPVKKGWKTTFLNFKFLHMIGVCHPTGINTGIVNEIHYLDPMPEGREREPSKRDFDGIARFTGKKNLFLFPACMSRNRRPLYGSCIIKHRKP